MTEELERMFEQDRAAAVAWAREVLADPKTVILDSETTGLYGARFVEIAVVGVRGEALFVSRLKPTVQVSEGAFSVHGISDEDLDGMPTFEDVYPALRKILEGRRVIVYNRAFDGPIYDHAVHGITGGESGWTGWECAMERYAEWVGEWNDYHQSYRWQRLPGGDHTALGDARATLAVIREMAAGHDDAANEGGEVPEDDPSLDPGNYTSVGDGMTPEDLEEARAEDWRVEDDERG